MQVELNSPPLSCLIEVTRVSVSHGG